MELPTTDPPLITFDPAPDAAERLRRLAQLLLGNAVSPVSPEGTAVQNTPRTTENDNATEQYPRHRAGST